MIIEKSLHNNLRLNWSFLLDFKKDVWNLRKTYPFLIKGDEWVMNFNCQVAWLHLHEIHWCQEPPPDCPGKFFIKGPLNVDHMYGRIKNDTIWIDLEFGISNNGGLSSKFGIFWFVFSKISTPTFFSWNDDRPGKKTVTEMHGKSDLYSCSIVSCKHPQETLPNPPAPLLQTVVSHPDEISRDSPHQYGCPEKTPRQPRCSSRYQGRYQKYSYIRRLCNSM